MRSDSRVDVSASSLHRLEELARAAGEAILDYYEDSSSPVDARSKSDGSPVTRADHAAHVVIVTELAKWDPEVPVISEEGTIPPYAERSGWTRFWLVDPLDGTKEFISRNGEFTVNIALIEDGEPVMGVIHAPAIGTTYVAGKGLGSWRVEAGGDRFAISSSPGRSNTPLRVVESRSHGSPELETYLATLEVGERVRVGSSLKFCRVAEGRADIYPRLGPTMEWDVAAGDCIYRNSAPFGPHLSSLTYNKPDLRNGPFVLGLGDPAGVFSPA
ncbi:MAG: 3'(2'),5'-bisphosphate nucleotidase CysQ, partial [Gemmatimonadota bacterium]|nr:3'(2'),5'-bisphosphate nucleotidase CysQ [Gemmatimonadota bacterium]